MLGGAVLVVSDFYALVWLSLRMALQGRRHHRAVLGTLGRVMLAPWAAIFLFFVMLPIARFDDETAKAMVAYWFLGSFGLDAILTYLNRQELKGGFRKLVAQWETAVRPSQAAFKPEPCLEP